MFSSVTGGRRRHGRDRDGEVLQAGRDHRAPVPGVQLPTGLQPARLEQAGPGQDHQ